MLIEKKQEGECLIWLYRYARIRARAHTQKYN